MSEEMDELEREIDRLFEDMMYERPMWDSTGECLEPLTQISEYKDKIIVTVDLPYVRKEDVIIDVTPTLLTIEAKMARPIRYERWGTIQRKCKFKGFKKYIRLPKEVVPEATNATFRNGFLKIELPKKVTSFKVKIE
jgi:HSP20 family protein